MMDEIQTLSMARSALYVLGAFVLMWIAKAVYTGVYRRVNMREQIFERGNNAAAVSVCGYLLGIVIAFGGVLSGPPSGNDWVSDLVDVGLFGLQTIALMILASFLCEKILLPKFDNTKEVVEDQNLGTAFVEAGTHIANGLILLAIHQGSGGHWWTTLAFWAVAQLALIAAALLYEAATPHSIHDELERDNAAVGLAFGGGLVGMGNIVSIAVAGDFVGWKNSLILVFSDAIFGLVVLFAIHKLTDLLLAAGYKLGSEQTGTSPKIGAGLLEAFGYVGGSMLIVWVY